MTESAGPDHDHMTIQGGRYCLVCGMSVAEMRLQAEHHMLVEAFTRLAAVLEKLEAKL